MKRGEKKLSEMTTELEVLRKERRDLEVSFTVRRHEHLASVLNPNDTCRL